MREFKQPLPSPADRQPPAGFTSMPLVDPFEAHLGPTFERTEANGDLIGAFYADQRHVRDDGLVHEGMMMTFADSILGAAASRAIEEGVIVTLSMQANYTGEAKKGDLILCRTRFEHRTSSLLFNSGRFFVGDKLIMTVSCLWKILEPFRFR